MYLVNEYSVWPLPYSGVPALLSGTSLTLLTTSLIVTIANTPDPLSLTLLALGILTGLLSCGRCVRVVDGAVVLEYGFPKPVIKLVIKDVTEVFDISELSWGRLGRYFKVTALPFILIMALPIAYVVVKGTYPNPAYLTVMALPLVTGMLLVSFFTLTSPTYRKFIKRAATITSVSTVSAVAFMIGYLYRETYGTSILQNLTHASVAIAGAVLIALLLAVATVMSSRNHVVVIRDSRGRYYALGTRGPEVAREVIREVLNVMVGSGRGDEVN